MSVRKNGHFTDEPYHFAILVQKNRHFLDKVRLILQQINSIHLLDAAVVTLSIVEVNELWLHRVSIRIEMEDRYL